MTYDPREFIPGWPVELPDAGQQPELNLPPQAHEPIVDFGTGSMQPILRFPSGIILEASELTPNDVRLPVRHERVLRILDVDTNVNQFIIPQGTRVYAEILSCGLCRWVPKTNAWIYLVEVGVHPEPILLWVSPAIPQPHRDGSLIWEAIENQNQ